MHKGAMKRVKESEEPHRDNYENENDSSINKENVMHDYSYSISNGNKKEKSLFIRKEIFDHSVIYTINKLEESVLLTYLRSFYEYFQKTKQNSSNINSMHNEIIYICLSDWTEYNELMNNQDNALFNIFSTNICKSLWILLTITLQCVRKKNNSNNQNTIFNTPYENLHIHKTNKKKNEDSYKEDRKKDLIRKYDKHYMKDNEDKNNIEHDSTTSSNEHIKGIYLDKKKKQCDNYFNVWNEGWLDEHICIELVIFFIILQFIKIDNVKKTYDKSLNKDCWPAYVDNLRSNCNNSNSSFVNINNLNSSIYRQNLSDFFNFCGKNYKHFLKSYLIAFLSSTDIMNSTLSNMPLYFKSYHFLLLDFIIDTNDSKNVHETFLLNNKHQILYKTKDILSWLLHSICMNDSSEKIETNSNISHSLDDFESSNLNYGIEKINDDIYEITNLNGKTLYINNDKNIINIINCKECSIFIISTVEYLKINFCVDCYIICLSVEMITTICNSSSIDIHLVTRCLKIENAIDTNIYVYTETNIIIFGDTRNIQLAPYNVLSYNQKTCLEKSKIVFNERNCELFAFPLKCKTNLCHSSLNLSNTLKNYNTNNIGAFDDNKALSREDNSGSICRIVSNSSTVCGSISMINGNLNTHNSNISNDLKKQNSSNKMYDHNNLSSSFTDYVYYLLNPSNFFLIEFSDNLCCRTNNVTDNTREKDNNGNKNADNDYNNKNKNTVECNKLNYNLSGYINRDINEKYVCLFLPEVYKNAIENQDEHILSFLNFMNSIKLTRSHKQKITKILTFKLYEYIRKSQRTSRVLNELITQDQGNIGVDYNNQNL